MEFAKKFVLVPEGSKHVPTQKQMSNFDREMLKVLNSTLSDYDKVQKYYELLQNKMKMEDNNTPWKTSKDDFSEAKKTNEESPSENVNEEILFKEKKQTSDYNTEILNAVPNSLKKQASSLLQLMKKNSNYFNWNEKGEIYVKGQILPNSNLADLFNLIFTNRKNFTELAGKNEFLNALTEMNIPNYYVKNKNIKQLSTTILDQDNKPTKRRRKSSTKWLSLK